MTELALWLDGNSIAGLLEETFAAEMTAASRRCQSCDNVNPVGAHRVYRGAGLVVRCPSCGDLAMTIVSLPGRHVVRLAGAWALEIRR